MRKTKIFIDASPLTAGHLSGVGHALLNLLKQMDSQHSMLDNYNICIFVPLFKKKVLAKYNFKFKLKTLPLPGRILNGLLYRGLLPPIDLFLGKGIYVFFNYRRLSLLFSKSILFVHDVAYKIFPEYVHPLNLIMLNRNLERWVNKSDLVVTLTEASKKEVEQQLSLPARKVAVMNCGIDRNLFKPYAVETIHKTLAKCVLPDSYFLFVSNIEPRKNVKAILEAYTSLPKPVKGRYALVLIGAEGWLNEAIMARIQSLQTDGDMVIRPEKYVSDVDLAVIMSGAKLLIHPAFHEGFGLTPLESLATGTPVVVSDIPAIREVLGDKAGIYIDPHKPQSITDGILKLVNSEALCNTIKQEGLIRAEMYSWERAVQQLFKGIRLIEHEG